MYSSLMANLLLNCFGQGFYNRLLELAVSGLKDVVMLQMLGLPSAGLRSFVLDSDPIPRAMLSIDPTFSFVKEWPAVKGFLQMRQWIMGQTAAPPVNPARFLYDNVGEVYLIKWTVGQGHKVC